LTRGAAGAKTGFPRPLLARIVFDGLAARVSGPGLKNRVPITFASVFWLSNHLVDVLPPPAAPPRQRADLWSEQPWVTNPGSESTL